MRCLTHSFFFLTLFLFHSTALVLKAARGAGTKGDREFLASRKGLVTGVSGVQNTGHRAKSQWTEGMHPVSTQPTPSTAWRAVLTTHSHLVCKYSKKMHREPLYSLFLILPIPPILQSNSACFG